MKKIIITNNPIVFNNINKDVDSKIKVEFYDVSYLDILKKVRDKVHLGHKILTHPLSGSIKPNETPYKSIMISEECKTLDNDSLIIIEESIKTAEKFIKIKNTPKWPEKILNDFQTIDYSLIKNVLQTINF